MREIEKAIDFLYLNIDFFAAPFISSPAFQNWAGRNPKIEALSSALKSAIGDSKEEAVHKKPARVLANFANALVGKALLHIDPETKELMIDTQCLLHNNREQIRSILINNVELLRVIKSSKKDPIITHWYKTAATPAQRLQRRNRRELNKERNLEKNEMLENIIIQFDELISEIKINIDSQFQEKNPTMLDEEIEKILHPFLNLENIKDLLFYCIVTNKNEYLGPLGVFKVIYYTENPGIGSISDFIKQNLGAKIDVLIRSTLSNFISAEYDHPILSKNLSALDLSIDRITEELAKNLGLLLASEFPKNKKIDILVKDAKSFIFSIIFTSNIPKNQFQLKKEIITFFKKIKKDTDGKEIKSRVKFNTLLESTVSLYEFVKNKSIRIQFYGKYIFEEKYNTKFHIARYLLKIKKLILDKLELIAEKDEKQRQNSIKIFRFIRKTLADEFYITKPEKLFSQIVESMFTTQMLYTIFNRLTEYEYSSSSAQLLNYEGVSTNFLKLFDTINLEYANLLFKLFREQKSKSLMPREFHTTDKNCLYMKVDADIFIYREMKNTDNYLLLSSGFNGKIKIHFSRETNIAFFMESANYRLGAINKFIKSQQTKHSFGKLPSDQEDLANLSSCILSPKNYNKDMTPFENFSHALLSIGVDTPDKLNFIINVLFKGRGALLHQLDSLASIFRTSETEILVATNKFELLVFAGYNSNEIIVYVKTPLATTTADEKLEETSEYRYQIVFNFSEENPKFSIINYMIMVKSNYLQPQLRKLFAEGSVIKIQQVDVPVICEPFQNKERPFSSAASVRSLSASEEEKIPLSSAMLSIPLSSVSSLFSSRASSYVLPKDNKIEASFSASSLEEFLAEIKEIKSSPDYWERIVIIGERIINSIRDQIKQNQNNPNLAEKLNKKIQMIYAAIESLPTDMTSQESHDPSPDLEVESLIGKHSDSSLGKDKILNYTAEDPSEKEPPPTSSSADSLTLKG